MQRPIAITEYQDESGKTLRGLLVGGILFDWAIEEDSLRLARRFAKNDPSAHRAVVGDILNHFIGSFQEFLGRPCTLKGINDAISAGFINVGESWTS